MLSLYVLTIDRGGRGKPQLYIPREKYALRALEIFSSIDFAGEKVDCHQ